MQVEELYDLAKWIRDNVESVDVVAHYQALQTGLNQQQSFEQQRESLFALLRGISLDKLSGAQIEMLDRFAIKDHLGEPAILVLEDILFRNNLDATTAAQKIGEIVTDLTSGIPRAGQILGALDDCIDETDYEAGEIPIRVVFTRDASIENLKDLKMWSGQWFKIVEGVTRAHGMAPEQVRIVGAGTGSIVLEMATSAIVLATTFGSIFLWGLKVTEKIMAVRKQAAEIRSLEIDDSAKIAKQLDQQADKIKKEEAEKITEKISINININQDGQGDKHIHLGSAVGKLLDFLDKGGEVDAWVPSEEEENDDVPEQLRLSRDELRETFEEIRSLESKLKLLEHKFDGED